MGLFNFDSLVGAQSVQNSLDHGKQGGRFFLAAFIDEQAHASNRRAVALRTIVKKVVWDGKNAYVYLFVEDGEADLPPIDQPMYPLGEDSE